MTSTQDNARMRKSVGKTSTGHRFRSVDCLASRRVAWVLEYTLLDYEILQSVAGTEKKLRRRFYAGAAPDWIVETGSALDAEYVKSLGVFDIVYSWGVLHHTGHMWQALDNARLPLAAGGSLFIAIYNDTGSQSARWKWIKQTYNRLPRPLRPPFALLAVAPDEMKNALRVHSPQSGDYYDHGTQYERTGKETARYPRLGRWL